MNLEGDVRQDLESDVHEPVSSPSLTAEGEALQAVRNAALTAGIDISTSLYNEAWERAHAGHFGAARDRLHVLLGLCPHDGEARVLLARVYVAGQRWRDALAQLDEAAACGHRVDEALRHKVVSHVQAEASSTGTTSADDMAGRDTTELRNASAKVRELRSDLAKEKSHSQRLTRELMTWMTATGGVTVVAILFIIIAISTSGTAAPEADAPMAPTPEIVESAPTTAATTAPTTAPTPPEGVVGGPAATDSDAVLRDAVGLALQAIPTDGLIGSSVSVISRNSVVELTGTVADYRQLAAFRDAAAAVEGVDRVVTERIAVTSATKGATHVVASGDQLGKLAKRYYGDHTAYQRILDANPSLGGKTALRLGQSLTIPPLP
ncbi:MAG: LysM peptidoglycan-binding domain-containing protein [Myxococcota bacterium]